MRIRLMVWRTFLCGLACGLLTTPWLPAADVTPQPVSLGQQLTESALQFELQGNNDYRQLTLQQALERDPSCETAQWHSGRLKQADQWLSVHDAMEANAADTRIATYNELRSQADQTDASLARWAQREGLSDRARLHWHRVASDPDATRRDQRAAISALDMERVDGILLDAQQRAQLTARQDQLKEEFATWKPKIRKWAKSLQSTRERLQAMAFEQIEAVRDRTAILPLETEISPISAGAAHAVIGALREMPSHHASESLARHALDAPWDDVVEQAALALQSRPQHEYVPMVLNRLRSPVTARSRVVNGADDVRVERVLYTEGIDANFLAYTAMRTDAGTASAGARARNLALFRANRVMQRDQRQLDEYNDEVASGNRRIFNVLETATEEVLPHAPTAWWDWWHEYNDVYEPRETEVDFRILAYRDAAIDDPVYRSPPIARSECFVAGTPVWTETGIRPIESIETGDRVLSQDQETGELAFKLVLQCSKRDPQPLVRMCVQGETVSSTKGHPYWVNGIGWRMARLVEPGDRLHGIDGSLEVEEVAMPAHREEVYNLVVDEFANYFVGTAGMLVHDNTYRAATRCIVPGLTQAPQTD